MPIFQDDLAASQDPSSTDKTNTRPSTSPMNKHILARKLSEESIRTDLCEGPLRGSLEEESHMSTGDVLSGNGTTGFGTSDRVELIERLKRGESPTWLPNRNLESLIQDYEQTPRRQSSNGSHSSPLLPAAEISEKPRPSGNDREEDRLQAGLQIERPRSALHSGNFTEAHQTISEESLLQTNANRYRSEQASWISTSPPRNFTPFQLDPRFPPADRTGFIEGVRSRAPSLSSSYSSSFILKPPTSPLVQSESNEELDLSSSLNPIDISSNPRRNLRRNTLHAPNPMLSSPSSQASSIFNNRPLPHLRRDNTFPYQAHQPRRSLTSSTSMMIPTSSPQTPAFLHSRRPSIDNSPLHASMVGSYEESILRGRMSTTPSKPLDFVAQIGVLGIGKCKSSLRCPAHVTLPFPAVFYSYDSTPHGRAGRSEDGPSPYVGQIDLENGLPNPAEETREKKQRATQRIRVDADDIDMIDAANTSQPAERAIRRAEKQKRRSTSPRAPLGGSYRIPEKGQVQIIIKNPNKTAVKLFLVPYDLAGMQPGTKTFIRQRSYSTGPVIEALSSTPQVPTSSSLDRPTLRYLVHLHICSPSRGRFYLYKSIRVVFANRVPDGKEKLRNEISLPEPRFSVYKPGRDSTIGVALSSAGATLAAEKALRRRSSGFGLGPSNRAFDAVDGILQPSEKSIGGGNYGRDYGSPVNAIPFSLRRKVDQNNNDSEHVSVQDALLAIGKDCVPPSQDSGSSMSWNSNSTGMVAYDKLHKGEFGYGGNAFANSPDGNKQATEGLLAQKLRDLGVGMQTRDIT